jgi:hypothetical protein
MKVRFIFIAHSVFVCLIILGAMGLAFSVSAATVVVPGTANPWLAGMPDGSMAFRLSQFDSAPSQSPIQVLDINIVAGSLFSFRASGSVSTTFNPSFFGPDGSSFGGHRNTENGISGTTNNVAALVGIFLGPDRPDLSLAPPDTIFFPVHQDYTLLSPGLRQVFFIGDGLTSMGVQQQVMVPDGATRLFLGVTDIFSVNGDNAGNFEVFVAVPEPGTLRLALLAVVLLAGWNGLRGSRGSLLR